MKYRIRRFAALMLLATSAAACANPEEDAGKLLTQATSYVEAAADYHKAVDGLKALRERFPGTKAATGMGASGPEAATGPAAAEERVVAAVQLAVESQVGIAMKLAELAHTNGKLEAQVEHLCAQLATAEAKVALLDAPKEEPSQKRLWWRLWS